MLDNVLSTVMFVPPVPPPAPTLTVTLPLLSGVILLTDFT